MINLTGSVYDNISVIENIIFFLCPLHFYLIKKIIENSVPVYIEIYEFIIIVKVLEA